ncbi:hypothetical protein LTR95_004640 [Oleoguttula sp. CCFEE 5521]
MLLPDTRTWQIFPALATKSDFESSQPHHSTSDTTLPDSMANTSTTPIGNQTIMLSDDASNLSRPVTPCGMRDSPPFTLPPELRNNVWELVFAGMWDDMVIPPLVIQPREPHPRLALLLTCKRIFDKAEGFAWQGVRATIDNKKPTLDHATDRPPLSKIQKAHWLTSTDDFVQQVFKEVGTRLDAIVQLDSEFDRMRDIFIERSNGDRDGGALKYAVKLLSSRLTGLQRIQIVDDVLHLTHMARGVHNTQDHLGRLHALFPSANRVEIHNTPKAGTVRDKWQISSERFAHVDSGTVWEAEVVAEIIGRCALEEDE